MSAHRRPVVPLTGAGRVIRVGVLGVTSLGLAMIAHNVGGGQLPHGGVLAVAALLLGLVAVPLTTKRLRSPALVSVLAVEQVTLHLAFTTTAAATCTPAGATGTGHHYSMIDSCAMSATHAAGMAMPGWPMWVLHALAVVATAWLLARGEAWLWRTADRIIRAAAATPSGALRRQLRPLLLPAPALVQTRSPYAPAAPRGPPAAF